MFTKAEITQIRLHKLGMVESFTEPITFIRQVIALQTQNHQPALVNFLQHVDMSWLEVEQFFASNQIIKIWANRLTLHTFLAEDWEMVFRVFGTRTNIVNRLCQKEGIDLASLLMEIDELGQKRAVFSRKELEAIIGEYPSQVISSIIAQATIAGILYLLPSSDAVKNYSHRMRLGNYQTWTSEPEANLEALMMLIRRYLKGYGPATWEDFRHWSGLNIGEIKPAIAGLEAELDTFTIESQTYVSLKGEKKVPTAQKLFLSGKFDQAVIAYKDPTWLMTEAQRKSAWTVNGHCSAIIVANNQAIGLWKYDWKKDTLQFTVSYFETPCFEAEIKQELEHFASRLDKQATKIQYKGI